MKMEKKYCPSNGSEGDWFIGTYCMNCIHEKYSHTLNDDDKKCDLLSNSMLYNVTDEEFPSEWTYDENGKPICTSYSKFDWDRDEDDDRPDKPKPVEPDDPMQLVLPFFEEFIEENISEEQLIEITQ